jgi:hypothetical protein
VFAGGGLLDENVPSGMSAGGENNEDECLNGQNRILTKDAEISFDFCL